MSHDFEMNPELSNSLTFYDGEGGSETVDIGPLWTDAQTGEQVPFDKALEHYGDNPLAFDGKGQAYRELDMLDEAEDFFQKAVQADPDNPSFLLNIGVLYHQFRQDTERALQYYLAYYERGGTDPNVRQWIEECGGSPPPSS